MKRRAETRVHIKTWLVLREHTSKITKDSSQYKGYDTDYSDRKN
jgi:hypothetical protein